MVTTGTKIDPILVEVIGNHLFQVILESAQTLKRVSGAVLTVEAADFAIDLFDAEGNTFVYSPIGLPRQGSAVRLALPEVLKQFEDDPGIDPEDIIITNDPYKCTLHIVDLLAIKPLYYNGELVMWIGVGIHKVDMGGLVPGISIIARNAYQEGIIIPPVKIVEKGKLKKEIVNLYMSNVRARGSQELDLRGQIAAVYTLDRRLRETISRYGVDTFKTAIKQLQLSSELVVRERLRTIPDGVYEFTDYIDHDGLTDKIYKVKCALIVKGDEATIDFTGTAPQSPGAFNASLACAYGAIHAGLLTIIAPDLSPNEGVFRPFKEIIPEASLFYTKHPAPCSAGATEAGYRAQSVFLGAMSRACGAGSAELREMGVSADWGGSFIWIQPAGVDHSGKEFTTVFFDGEGMGGGARAIKDGFGCSCLHTTVGAQFQNAEVLEREYPVLHLKRGYQIDTPGAGLHRGGSGTETELMVYDTDRLEFTIFHNRRYPPPWGIFGGGPGAAAWVRVKRNTNAIEKLTEKLLGFSELDGEEEILPQKLVLGLQQGDVLSYCNPGGGGYGDPLDRDPGKVKEDVIDEYVSKSAAERLYGVVLTGEVKQVNVDDEATAALRNKLRMQRRSATIGSEFFAQLGF